MRVTRSADSHELVVLAQALATGSARWTGGIVTTVLAGVLTTVPGDVLMHVEQAGVARPTRGAAGGVPAKLADVPGRALLDVDVRARRGMRAGTARRRG
jgi:hypothetical protein